MSGESGVRGPAATEFRSGLSAGLAQGVLVVPLYVACWIFFGADLKVESPVGSSSLATVRMIDFMVGHGAFVLMLSGWDRRATLVLVPLAVAVSSFAIPVLLVLVARVGLTKPLPELVRITGLAAGAFALHGFVIDPLTGSPFTRSQSTFNVLSEIGVTGCVGLAGWLWSSRRHEREARAEARRADAVLHERTRIAREMHDSLAHRLTLVALHSGALAQRPDLSPEARQTSARIVHDGVREAVDELRAALGSLRSTPTTELPQPKDLADLDALVETARACGQRVEMTRPRELSTPTPPPALLSRHIYRIVQESLTNARKHSPGQPVSLLFDGAPGGHLRVRVANPARSTAPRGAGGGFGLVGMAERVSQLGGRLTTGREGGEFVVDVVVPWPSQREHS